MRLSFLKGFEKLGQLGSGLGKCPPSNNDGSVVISEFLKRFGIQL